MALTTSRTVPAEGLTLPSVLGVVHFIVDAASNFVVVGLLGTRNTAEVVVLLFVYNALAFALQPLVGVMTDKWRAPRGAVSGGLLLAAAAMVGSDDASGLAIVLTGVGNALFHVGAGTLVSRSNPGRAAGLGIFIGPGAVGVVAGATAARSFPGAHWILLAVLLALAPLSAFLPSAECSKDQRHETAAPPPPHSTGILLLLLAAIAGRAFLGARVGATLAHQFAASLVFAFAVAACLGKIFGGLLADRTGWRRSSIALLIAASLLLSGGKASLWRVLGAIGLFQAVTSITLAALYRVLPRHTGVAFGLACLALFVGSLPALLRLELLRWQSAPLDTLVALASAAAIWFALGLLDQPGAAAVARQPVASEALD